MDNPSSEKGSSAPPKKEIASATSVRNWCILGFLLVALSCVGCVTCSFIAAVKSEQADPAVTVSILGIAVSIWVALNIYNIISNKEIQQVHTQAETIKKRTKQISKDVARAQAKMNDLSSDITKVQAEIEHSIQMKIQNDLATIINTISQNTAYYSFTGHLITSFQKLSASEELKKLPYDIWGLIIRIENSFSAAAALNRANVHEERARLAQIGLNYCNALRNALDSEGCHEFINAYCNLRTGDFLFYQGYRIQTTLGLQALDRAIVFYTDAFNGMFTLCATETQSDNLANPRSYIQIENDHPETTNALLMRAYLSNIIGECYNVRSQYNKIHIDANDLNTYKENAVRYFAQVYSIKNDLEKNGYIPPLFAKYLRNYGTALEKLPSQPNTLSPGELYKEALQIDSKDMLSYYTYSIYHLRDLQVDIAKQKDPKLYIRNKSEFLLLLVDYLNIYITSNPTLYTAHFLKTLAYLMLAFGNDEQLHLDIACEEYRLVKVLNPDFKLNETTHNLTVCFLAKSDSAALISFLVTLLKDFR